MNITPAMVIDSLIQQANKEIAVNAFLVAYDAWAVSNDLCGGPLFDEMVMARQALQKFENE